MRLNPQITESRFTWRPFAVLAVLVVTALIFSFRSQFIAADLASVYLISSLVAVASVVVVGAAGRLRLWSSAFLFTVVFASFHLGIPMIRLLGATVEWSVLSYTNSWLGNTPQVRMAIWLCVVSLVGFVLGYLLTSGRRDDSEVTFAGEGRLPTSFAVPGLILVGAGAAIFMGYAAFVAPSLYLGAGKSVYEATIGGSAVVGWGTLLTSVGIIIATAAPSSRARTWTIAIFIIFALFTLAIGSRTAALYAIVGVVVAAARVRKMPRSRTAVLLILSGLLVVSTVEQIRGSGWSQASVGEFLGSPAAGLQEMGASLRPVVETVAQVESGRTEYRNGETYFVTLIRVGETVLGIERPTPDERWADAVVSNRTDGFQIGYSAVAEAYLNFGALGTFLAFTVLGSGFGLWDSRRLGDATAAARVAITFVALIAVVRQSSNSLLVTIIFGLLAVEVARVWSARATRRTSEEEGSAPGLSTSTDRRRRHLSGTVRRNSGDGRDGR